VSQVRKVKRFLGLSRMYKIVLGRAFKDEVDPRLRKFGIPWKAR